LFSVGVEVSICPQGTSSENGVQDACAFNVESIQIDTEGPANITGIRVDGVTTLLNDAIPTPTNLLVDSGIGKIGASREAVVLGVPDGGAEHSIEFNGEKPQGMELCLFEQRVDEFGNTTLPKTYIQGNCGTIIIQKFAENFTSTLFNFTAGGGLEPSSFSLFNGEIQVFEGVRPGTYPVAEESNGPADQTTIMCSDPDNGTQSVTIGLAVQIDMDPGETIYCAFHNEFD
jgi:hypothetical protein